MWEWRGRHWAWAFYTADYDEWGLMGTPACVPTLSFTHPFPTFDVPFVCAIFRGASYLSVILLVINVANLCARVP